MLPFPSFSAFQFVSSVNEKRVEIIFPNKKLRVNWHQRYEKKIKIHFLYHNIILTLSSSTHTSPAEREKNSFPTVTRLQHQHRVAQFSLVFIELARFVWLRSLCSTKLSISLLYKSVQRVRRVTSVPINNNFGKLRKSLKEKRFCVTT